MTMLKNVRDQQKTAKVVVATVKYPNYKAKNPIIPSKL